MKNIVLFNPAALHQQQTLLHTDTNSIHLIPTEEFTAVMFQISVQTSRLNIPEWKPQHHNQHLISCTMDKLETPGSLWNETFSRCLPWNFGTASVQPAFCITVNHRNMRDACRMDARWRRSWGIRKENYAGPWTMNRDLRLEAGVRRRRTDRDLLSRYLLRSEQHVLLLNLRLGLHVRAHLHIITISI